METNKEYIEIDLLQFLQALWQRMWVIILTAAIAAGIAFTWTRYFVQPLYKASAQLYVNNSSVSLGSTNFSISTSELTAAQSLVDTYIVILQTRTTLEEVIKEADVDYSYEELSKMIDASAVNGTEVFSVTVTSTDPYEAEKIANTIAVVLPNEIADIVEGSDVRIVDYAVVPAQRSSPSYTMNTTIGFLIGLVLSAAVIIIRQLTDTLVRTEDHLTHTYNIPVLAAIPNMAMSEKDGGRYQPKPKTPSVLSK